MVTLKTLQQQLQQLQAEAIESMHWACGELTVVVHNSALYSFCQTLRDEFDFDMLIDLCGVDYAQYGIADWQTEQATSTGFSRAVAAGTTESGEAPSADRRFAVVYHLLSLEHNLRLRVKTFLSGEPPIVPTVNSIWASANWFEREAFDLYGILFDGHPDLRRILTDYGFIGHPFRKDFPLSGHVEVRYDAKQRRVVYEPVDIVPRVLVPKVIRHDSRYSESDFVKEDKAND